MVKTKPAQHIKRNDVLVFDSNTSNRTFEDIVIKVEDYKDEDNKIKVFFGPKHQTFSSGQKYEIQPSCYVVFDKNEQVSYKS
jgi:hypothetical protein